MAHTLSFPKHDLPALLAGTMSTQQHVQDQGPWLWEYLQPVVQPFCPRAEAASAQLLPPWQWRQEGSWRQCTKWMEWGCFLARMEGLHMFDSLMHSEVVMSGESTLFFFAALITLVPTLAAAYFGCT